MAVPLYVCVCALVGKLTVDIDTVWVCMTVLHGGGVYHAASHWPGDRHLGLCTRMHACLLHQRVLACEGLCTQLSEA